MASRTTARTVTFWEPFELEELDEELPSGDYIVETDEERLESVSFPAFRRILTVIHLRGEAPHPGRLRTLAVAPQSLDAALARDRDRTRQSRRNPPIVETAKPDERRTTMTDDKTAGKTGADAAETPATGMTEEGEMERFGIERVRTEYFRLGEYRYTNLRDALNQARRMAKTG